MRVRCKDKVAFYSANNLRAFPPFSTYEVFFAFLDTEGNRTLLHGGKTFTSQNKQFPAINLGILSYFQTFITTGNIQHEKTSYQLRVNLSI